LLPRFRVAYAKATWRQTEVSLRPLICFGQTRASRPPPHQHRDPIRGALARWRGTTLASAFPDCSGAFSVTDRATLSQTGFPAWSRAVHLSLAASGHRMSLATLLPRSRSPTWHGGRLWYAATPDSSGESEPPERHR